MERKLTAILCADVFGYSRLMGDDEARTIIDPTFKLMIAAVRRDDGYMVQSTPMASSRCSAPNS